MTTLDLGNPYAGVEASDRATADAWRAAIDAIIKGFAASGQEFTPDHVRAYAERLGLPAQHPNRWGPRFTAAHRSGVIQEVGAQHSTAGSRRASLTRVWRGAA